MSESASILEAPVHPKTAPASRVRWHRRRQVVMASLLVVLCGIIGGYWFLTDSNRVRTMAEKYLSELVGGRVTVARAHLSIFEGLRLEGVEVYVDDKDLPDSRILSARLFQVKTSIRDLLQGRLESTQILAIQPVVYLCENLDIAEWNVSRIGRQPRVGPDKPHRTSVPSLPEIVLRGGTVAYSRIQGGRHTLVGTLSIDGQLLPDAALLATRGRLNRFGFNIEMRSPGKPEGPHLRGTVDLARPTISAQLDGLKFDDTIRLMLPSQVQQWWDVHQLRGAVNIPRFTYSFGRKARPQAFEIEVQLNRVQLTVFPEEILGPKAYERLKASRPGLPVAAHSGLQLAGYPAAVAAIIQPLPMQIKGVSGRFVFTEDQIRFSGVTGVAEGNTICMDGRIDGYRPNRPAFVRIVANQLAIPHLPRYLNILPADVRREYDKFRPEGVVNMVLELRRDRENGDVDPTIYLHMLRGSFCFEEFLYPLHDVNGAVRFGRDPRTGWQRVDLIDISGKGIAGTRNGDREIHVNGSISPVDRRSRVDIRVHGDGIYLDQRLRDALPPEAREAMAMFDRHVLNQDGSPSHVVPVELFGEFEARLIRDGDPPRKLEPHVYLKIRNASGAFNSFAYPLENVTGEVDVHPEYVLVRDIVGHHSTAALTVNGRVDFGKGKPVAPSLTLDATNIPIDQTLLDACTPDVRRALQKLELGGVIDKLSGRVFLDREAMARSAKSSPLASEKSDDFIDFDLALKLRDGRIWPVAGKPLVSDIVADLHLTRSQLTIKSAVGKQVQADITADGLVSWPGGGVSLAINVDAKNLSANPMNREICPDEAREWWDLLRFAGEGDVKVVYRGAISTDEKPGAPPPPKPFFDVIVRPKSLTVNPVTFPWPMTISSGELHVTPDKTTLSGIRLRHGDATIDIGGGSTGDGDWTLKLVGDKLVMDEPLRKALPAGIRGFVESVKLRGPVSFDCPKLEYRSTTRPATAAASTTTQPLTDTYLHFTTTVAVADGSMDAGVPLTAINGSAKLEFDIRNGDLYWMGGTIDAPSLLLAGRPLKDLHGIVERPEQKAGRSANDPDYRFTDLSGHVGGGNLACRRIEIFTPAVGSPAYEMDVVIQDVDIPTLTGEKDPKIRGVIKMGSLNIMGKWDDPRSRRGAGSVVIEGKELYKVPVVFGLLQIANLALPIKSPFNRASASYVIDGASQRVTLIDMELSSANMVMKGRGQLDFAKMTMEMVINTENPDWAGIPIIGSIINTAKSPLTEIRAKGTIQNPKISSGAMNTFGTMIDQMFPSEPTPPKRQKQ